VSLRRPTGQAAFAGDVVMPGTLHLALRRSPVAHGRVLRADASSARALPGVAAVLTSADVPRLLSPELLFVGDRLAIAAAEEPELARRAVEMVALEIERLPAILDPEAAAADEASVACRLAVAHGDVERALAEAEHVVAGDWHLPFTPALSLEPPQAITWLDEDRRLVVRTSAESPFRVRRALADRLALPAAGIRVVRPLVAGGTAGDGTLPVEDVCAAVTLRTGRPARLALSGNEQLTASSGRPAQRVSVRVGVRDGRIVALDLRFALDLGATDERAFELLRSAARHALATYAAGSVRVEAVAVRTHRPPTGTSRGADAGAAFAVECAVDEAARIAGEDPGDFRSRQLRGPAAPAAELLAGLGEPAGDDDARALTALLAALPRGERGRRHAADAAIRSGSGLGLARRSSAVASGAGPAASLRLLEDGSFTLSSGTSTVGGADENAETEAAAAILTVPSERVVAAAADSDSAAFEAGEPSAAFVTPTFAVEEAARLARERIREAGARLLGVPLTETTVESGRVLDSQGRSVGFAEIGTAALSAGAPLFATTAPTTASTPPSYAAAHAEVDVDIETGVVRVTRIAAAVAAGPFPDARPHEAVVEGALAVAVEQGLAAGLPFDGEGRPLVRSLRDYPLVAPIDVPPLMVSLVPSGAAPARLGGAALADVSTRAALAAIANAVAQATGAPVRCLPLSPPVVLDALETKPRD
jgi:putative selenate reductase molybdopterin-binding subunit